MPMKGSRGTALPTANFSTKIYGGQRHAPAVLPQGKTAGTPCTSGWVGLGGGWMGLKKLAPPRIEPRSVQPTRYMRSAYIRSALALIIKSHSF